MHDFTTCRNEASVALLLILIIIMHTLTEGDKEG